MDSRADALIKQHEGLAAERAQWESHWREVAERVRPNHNIFSASGTDGDKRNEKMFDSTAALALSKFTAAVISMAFPASQTYQKITVRDKELSSDSSVMRVMDDVTDVVFRNRYAPDANFQAQSCETVMDVGAFGTGVFFIDDLLGVGLRYKSVPLAQCYIAEDAYGRVDTLFRKILWTAPQAASRFGADRLPEAIQRALEREQTRKFVFLHAVTPNRDRVTGALDYRGMAYSSAYVAVEEGRNIIEEGGYRTFPFAVPRFETAPGEPYGRSPAMMVLPSIKTLNEQKKTVLQAGQLAVSPPIMLSDDGALQSFNRRPNALNFGAVDDQGRPRAIPFETRGRVDIGLDLMNAERETINDAFFVTLFRILVEEPQITATEAMLRAQEKGQLLAPTMGRMQAEFLGPTTRRELDILHHAGALPNLPDKIKHHFLRGGTYDIEYQSPLNLAQKAGQGIAIMNTLNAIAPLAQIDQSVMLRFDLDKSAEHLARINGMPEELIRSDEELTGLKEQQASAAQAKQLLEAAPVAAGAARDFAQAGALAASSPSQIAPDLGLPE